VLQLTPDLGHQYTLSKGGAAMLVTLYCYASALQHVPVSVCLIGSLCVLHMLGGLVIAVASVVHG
jgi:hypothetical protein